MDLTELQKGRKLNGDSGNDPETIPDWMDFDRFRRGQEFFKKHMGSVILALHCSITVGFGVPNLAIPLAYTKKSDTSGKAAYRYLQTFAHITLWHVQDVWDPTTLAHKSTQLVRRMHAKVRQSMNKKYADEEHLSQYDMALVQAGFMAAVFMYPSEFGINCTRKDLGDYVFFWRGIGYLLGIADAFNICSGDYEETYAICKQIEDDIVYQGLLHPTNETELLTRSYIDGVNMVTKLKMNSIKSIVTFSLGTMKRPRLHTNLDVFDRLRLVWLNIVVKLTRWCPGFERFANWMQMRMFYYLLPFVNKQLAVEKVS